jgi:hypothetical protein
MVVVLGVCLPQARADDIPWGLNPNLNGMIIGPSSVAQLHETLDFYRNIETFDYTDVRILVTAVSEQILGLRLRP